MVVLLLGDSDFGRVQLRQIRQAMAAGLMGPQDIVAAGERAAELADDPAAGGVRLVAEPAGPFLLATLASLPDDARVIPPPIGRHVFADLLAGGSGGRLFPPDGSFPLPFARAGDGVLYLSAAAWTCPIDCMAPRICPRIGLGRPWHLPSLLRQWARERGLPSIVFAPRGPASGAEGVAAARLKAALRRVRRSGSFLVATSAPCHAAASLLEVAARS